MSSLVGKVKEALNPHSGSSEPEGTHGPHATRSANAADPRVDSDRDHRGAPGTHTTHNTTNTYTTPDNYTLGSDNRGLDGPATKTDGPHNSNILNKVDPRVDSDRDHSKNLGLNPSGTATTGNTTTGHSTAGHTTTGHTTTGATEGIHGPHGSRAGNALDPRVDSDRDHSRTVGNTTGAHTGATGLTGGTHTGSSDLTGSSHTGAHTGTTGLTGGSHTGNTNTFGTQSHGTSEGAHGPHGSRVANALDPRVDSDRDHSRTVGGNTHTSGTTGLTGNTHGTSGLTGSHGHTAGTSGLTGNTHSTGTSGLPGSHGSGAPEGTYGPHSSRVANAADPRVDSGRDNRGAAGHSTLGGSTHTGAHTGAHTGTHTGAHTGTTGLTGATGTHATGPAPNTAGPHKSDLLNKIDPRVDSDLDGSKTNPVTTHKDPTDAAQVPPSVLQKHIGPPVVEHDDHGHDRSQRHSVSHQERHRGL